MDILRFMTCSTRDDPDMLKKKKKGRDIIEGAMVSDPGDSKPHPGSLEAKVEKSRKIIDIQRKNLQVQGNKPEGDPDDFLAGVEVEPDMDRPELEVPDNDVQQLRKTLSKFGCGHIFPWLRQEIGCRCLQDVGDLSVPQLERRGLSRRQAESLKCFADGYAAATMGATPWLGVDGPLTCPEGHVLKRFVAEHDEYVCDVCKKKQATGSVLLGSRASDYDVCLSCAEPMSKDPSLAGAPPFTLVVCFRGDVHLSARESESFLRRAMSAAVVDANWHHLRAWKAQGSPTQVLEATDAKELRRISQRARKMGARVERIEDRRGLPMDPGDPGITDAGSAIVVALGPAPTKEMEAVTQSLRAVPAARPKKGKKTRPNPEDSQGSSD